MESCFASYNTILWIMVYLIITSIEVLWDSARRVIKQSKARRMIFLFASHTSYPILTNPFLTNPILARYYLFLPVITYSLTRFLLFSQILLPSYIWSIHPSPFYPSSFLTKAKTRTPLFITNFSPSPVQYRN